MNKTKLASWKKLTSVICIVPMLLTACGAPGAKDKLSDDGQSGGKKTVTISVMASNRFLEYAEQAYEQAHPDTNIVIKQYQEPQELGDNKVGIAMTQEDFEKYVNTMNTEMLSGKGPDILLLSGLPVGKYVSKNLLANFYDLMKNDSEFKKDNYFQNIWKSLEINGGLYSMPLGASISLTQGNKKLLDQAGVTVKQPWTWEDYIQASVQTKKKLGDDIYATGNASGEFFLYNLVAEQYSKFVDTANRKAHFESPLFRQYVEKIDSMIKNKIISKDNVDQDHVLFNKMQIGGVSQYAMFKDALILRNPSMDQKNNLLGFNPSQNFAINGNSANKDEAWNFIKFLLSDEIQNSPEMNGIPMNKTVYNKQFDDVKTELKSGKITTNYGEVTTDMSPETLETFRPLIEQANSNMDTDNKIITMLFDEMKPYFEGQKSLDESIQNLQSRVMTYLNE